MYVMTHTNNFKNLNLGLGHPVIAAVHTQMRCNKVNHNNR